MRRFGMVIRVKPEKFAEYKKIHDEVWPECLESMHRANIHNYTMYHKDGWLFSTFEYHGTDFAADMARNAAEPIVQKWNAICQPCHEPLPTRKPGEWWAQMDEIFHAV